MGNVHLRQAVAVAPYSIEELQQHVSSASPPLRVIGSGHSFTPLCFCEEVGTLVSMRNLRRVWDLRVSGDSSSIVCEGGTSLPHFET
jgi:FAD/FMN-containing dehydrogenase